MGPGGCLVPGWGEISWMGSHLKERSRFQSYRTPHRAPGMAFSAHFQDNRSPRPKI